MGDVVCSEFARELDLAFNERGMTVGRAVRELDVAGFDVPARALENWLRGFFLPRSREVGEVVSALETILGVEPCLLVQALALDIASGKSFVPGEEIRRLSPASPDVIDGVLDRKFAASDAETDWAAEVIREALDDEITLSKDLCAISHRVTTWGRVPAAPNPTLNAPVVYEANEVPTHTRLIYGIEGARLAGQKVYEMEDGLVNVTSRLALPDDAEPGERCRVAFTCDYARSDEMNRATERFFGWPLRHYSLTVRFLGKMPERIEYVFAESLTEGDDPVLGEETATVLEPVDGVVRYLRENNPRGIGYLQWS